MEWTQGLRLFFLWVLCSMRAISCTTGADVDPRLTHIAHFLNEVVTEMSEQTCSDMATNISDLTMQMSVLYEEMVNLNESITERVCDVCRMDESPCVDVDKQNIATSANSQPINGEAESTANHSIRIAELEENIATCLQTSEEQSKTIHQMQQNIEIMQERLDALNQTFLQDKVHRHLNNSGSEDVSLGKSSRIVGSYILFDI